MAKTYLWCPSSGLYSCPLAMTDGAAMLIKVRGGGMELQCDVALCTLGSHEAIYMYPPACPLPHSPAVGVMREVGQS